MLVRERIQPNVLAIFFPTNRFNEPRRTEHWRLALRFSGVYICGPGRQASLMPRLTAFIFLFSYIDNRNSCESCFVPSTLGRSCLHAVGNVSAAGFSRQCGRLCDRLGSATFLSTLERPRGRLRKGFDPTAGATVWRRQIRNGRQVANQSLRKAAALLSTARSILACALRQPGGTSFFQQSVPLSRLSAGRGLRGTKRSRTRCLTSRRRSITT